METWWRVEEKDGGVYLQNQVVSLSRDVPVGLDWLIEPFVRGIPKESLEFTLGSARRAVLAHPANSSVRRMNRNEFTLALPATGNAL